MMELKSALAAGMHAGCGTCAAHTVCLSSTALRRRPEAMGCCPTIHKLHDVSSSNIPTLPAQMNAFRESYHPGKHDNPALCRLTLTAGLHSVGARPPRCASPQPETLIRFHL